MNDSHSKENNFTVPTKTKWGQIHRHAPVIIFSRSKMIAEKPMNLGEHTNSILKEIGYNQKEIKSLINGSMVHEEKK